MNGPQLNLARKWRSKSFDQVVGQLLPVRMLKNSLYLESFFPVYLFSGQRGCGKTTMARIFATAINCEKLSEFQKNPKNNAMPCLICSSCAAMIEGHHPDFIEIDAASHTGVDNVRNIIDAASLMPIMGRKKIYLIDEAHMLSKAAFNAFLKILEEPPASVLFILATTDAQKIIDTVRSRCFQLFFGPVDAQPLLNHLIAICEKENIHYDQQGLKLIVDSTEGSVRDAINLLEQVRFSTNNVTKQAVLVSLGHLDDERIVALLNTLLLHSCADVLKYTEKNKLQLYSADFLWQKLSDMVRALVWIKHGVKPHFFTEYNTQLSALAGACSLERLNNILEIFYSNETVFKKTTAQYALLEMIFLKISQKNSVDDNSGASSIPQQVASDDEELVEDMDDEGIEDDEGEEEETDEEVDAQVISFNALWAQFLKQVPLLQDALLNSLFSQAACQSYDNDTAQLHVIFSKELAFFKDWLTNTNAKWQPLLDGSFGKPVILVAQFTGTEIKKTVKVDTVASVSHNLAHKLVPVSNKAQEQKSSVQQAKPAIKPVQSNPPQPYKKQDNKYSSFRKNNFAKTEPLNPRIDVSDKSIWKKANLVLHYFPGVMREIKENIHEQKA